ncbi:hypothetical protein V8B97DRAFT_2011082 [Scleroderma yunnanense]
MDPIHLPEYEPSTPAPDYSSRPLPGERCIERTPKQTISHQGQLSFTYQEHGMSLTLRGCREEGSVPTFGLCSTVHGEFEPIDREKIVSITVKLEGRVVIKNRSRISSSLLFSRYRTLWESDSAETVCPGILPLSMAFPAHYLDSHTGRDTRLPPSLSISRPRRAAVIYSLTVTVRKKRGLFFCMRSPREVSIIADLRYSPRVRPPRPSPMYFSALKQSPDEWLENVWSIEGCPLQAEDSRTLMVQCHLFLPSVRVFSVSECIPFHLSLCGSTTSLQSMLKSLAPDRVVEEEAYNDPIHVFVVRQTIVHTDQGKAIHEEILGNAELTTSELTVLDAPLPEDAMFRSWNGQLRCEKSITCSGFTTSVLEVKDFVVLSLVRQLGSTKSLKANLRHDIPIRIVTHPYVDRL